MIIIGITGTLGAGKGTVVDYLVKEKGFKHYSVRDFLTKLIEKEGHVVNRDSMVEIANRLRAQYGPSFLVEEIFKEAQKSKGNCIIESLRTEGEIKSLREKGNFYLLAVDADPKLRYERVVKRGTETDKISFQKFIGDEKREMTSNDPNKQNLRKCMELANYTIQNNSTIEALNKRVSEIIYEIEKEIKKTD
jgi:dephospho-CoA kinase